MRARRGIAAVIFVAAVAGALHAAPSADPFAEDRDGPSVTIVDLPPRPDAGGAVPPPRTGNPLWAIPLSVLAATRERPLFAPSRRAPPRAVAGAPPVPTMPLAPPPPEPLALSLIGAVVGDDDAIAVFLDLHTQGIVRLRTGETHAGWSLTSIEPRAATLTRGPQTETVAIRRSDVNTSPFVPRARPKNGESDGL